MKVPALLVVVALAATCISLAAQSKKPTISGPANRTSVKHAQHPTAKSKAVSAKSDRPRPVERRTNSTLTLLYTASADGQIRSCNCTKFRFGGYGRELTLLNSMRPKPSDMILIEGGDACGDTGFQAELKAKVSSQALSLLGYGVMTPGEKELGVRGTRYTSQFASNNVPIVCANLFDSGQNKPLFRPYVVLKTSSGLRVAMIGCMDRSLCDPWLATSFGQVVKDPSEVLPPIIKEARRKSDLVVLIYHGTIESAGDIRKIKGIDMVLATHKHSQDRLFPGKDSNIVQVPVEKQTGALIVQSETSTNWCLGRLDLQLGPNLKITSAKHQLFYLDRSYEEAPAMVKMYEAYNESVKQAVLASSAEFKKNAESLLAKRGFSLVEMRQRLHKITYATSAKCVDCHPQISAIWAGSKHAHAMATLESTHQEYDPECIRCHTTGAMQRGGFTDAKDTPELGNVQCEACHGSAVTHMAAPEKGFGRVTEETCRACHTDERTPDFDYAASWAKIMH